MDISELTSCFNQFTSSTGQHNGYYNTFSTCPGTRVRAARRPHCLASESDRKSTPSSIRGVILVAMVGAHIITLRSGSPDGPRFGTLVCESVDPLRRDGRRSIFFCKHDREYPRRLVRVAWVFGAELAALIVVVD